MGIFCFSFILHSLLFCFVKCSDTYIDIYNRPNVTWGKNDIVFALNLPHEICLQCIGKISGSGYNLAKHYASAAALAVSDINNDSTILKDYNLYFVWNENETDTHCDEFDAIRIQLKQMRLGVHGFVGFACSCLTVAKNAAAMNLPLLSMSCSEGELSDKTAFPTFARTTAINYEVVFMLESLFKRFNWTQFAVLYEETHIFSPIYNGLKKLIKRKGTFEITLEETYSKIETVRGTDESLHHKFDPFLAKLPKKARIVLLLVDKKFLSQFLFMAESRGLTDGEYAYIAVHPFATTASMLFHTYHMKDVVWFLPWRQGENENIAVERLQKSYQSLMVLLPEYQPKYPPYDEFKKKVVIGLEKPPFNFVFPNTTNWAPPAEASLLYDAVKLYAVGLNKTISQGQDFRNGTAIIDNIKGLKQTSITGQNYVVNRKADVQKYFEVLQFQIFNVTEHPLNSSNESLKRWTPKKVFRVVPIYNASQPNLTFELLNSDEKPYWRNGIPRDVPVCGFNNEKCKKESGMSPEIEVLVSSLVILSVISIVFFAFLYRYYNIRKELNSQLWKISTSDLYFHDWKGASASSLGSLTSETLTMNQKFTIVAVYKGSYVAIKKIQRKSVELTESVLVELKQMRDIRHNNLNPFVGACVELNNIMIIYQYAAKGSLQDILENSDIKLDKLFILSLLHDIVKGMMYLHSTDIKSHGNLKSSNCVVDSRWVLKVTDYGLESFRNDHDTSDTNFNKLLWKAPELLRSNASHLPSGTQKGDVYSFAIILQECQTRDGAWGSACPDAETIIERVRKCSNPPFRPIVPQLLDGAEGLRDVMKKCWVENPEERPSFNEICKDIEGMMKANGLETNIFDNMIYMMEKYSNNLEEIVEERTSSLIDEKHKVEGLLERMLPQSVARQLMKGKDVEAEMFEEVTIYFSDIVGFTNICSSITPMEVVQLLNCLYTMFDGAAKDYDVYKVETIGDAYMVVSGLPVRNGKQHVKEICLFALDILQNVHTFKTWSANEEQLRIRIGIHCGPVVAGVVGTTMPRYCLFGDTVNVASRMESTGEALRIHISKYVKDALECFHGFYTEPRGLIEVKGKGELETFWLTGIDPGYSNRGSNLKRAQNDFYHCQANSSIYDFIRESPKPIHNYQKNHVMADFIQSSPFVSSSRSDVTTRKNIKDLVNGFALFTPLCLKKKKEVTDSKNGAIELVDTDTDQLLQTVTHDVDVEPSEKDRLTSESVEVKV